MKYPVIVLLCGFLSISISDVSGKEYSVSSPDGQATVKLGCSDSDLDYELSWNGQTLIEKSPLSILTRPRYKVLSVETKMIDECWKPVWGAFSQIRDHANELVLKLEISGVEVELKCRVYNDGIGFRFSAPSQPDLRDKRFELSVDYRAKCEFSAYWGEAGSRSPSGPIRSNAMGRSRAKMVALPFVMHLDSGQWVALLESDLYSAELFKTGRFLIKPNTSTIQSVARFTPRNDGFITPWKVVLFGNQAGDLLTNVVALNLAAPCKMQDASWIQPGKGLWDWRIHGYDNGSFEYGIDTRSYLRQIDFCVAHEIEYLTIDDYWFTSAKDGQLEVSPDVDIEAVIRYANDHGVRVMLYYDEHKGKFGDDRIFDHYAHLGAVGIKYGFRGNNVPFTRQAIRAAADAKLMVFFHDGPVPMVGVERTMPNMISREYGHGQQDARRVFTPKTFLKTAMINGLVGPLDLSNGNFGIESINAGERMKGPKEKNSYVTTVVSEVARCLIINSALVTLPDAPEEYDKKADLFDFLEQMPVTWDDTKVPNCQMGEFLTVARRSGDVWFVGSVNSESHAREISIQLDFLTEGISYEAKLYRDTEETDGITNPESYEVVTRTVESGQSLSINMALGGGHAMILTPIP
ncbi:alpha-glucosidase [Rhodopirellula rubra]|uniref:Alpha-glucosidase n=1 Tax=Aporhodopirellula rubra TaxID=980271 RepID=A0A7W5E3E1_9BACT|nr:glycoside hydrolase family 97 protein [Aporhodopirellula rubra]MBB3209480.1 alpha-glucosidase [Aporhodopirellula rubra]